MYTSRGPRRRWGWPRSRAGGCLLLVLLVIVLSVLFGGFQKGTKVNSGLVPLIPLCTSCTSAPALPTSAVIVDR